MPFLTSLDLSRQGHGYASLASKMLFFRTEIRDATLRIVNHFPHLQKLDVSKTRITDAGLQHLSTMLEIEHLELNGTHVADGGICHLVHLKTLKYLGLYKTQVTPFQNHPKRGPFLGHQ